MSNIHKWDSLLSDLFWFTLNIFDIWGEFPFCFKKKVANSRLKNYEICSIGKDDIRGEFKYLLVKHPEIMEAIPYLIASRDKSFDIITTDESCRLSSDIYDFSKRKLEESDINRVLEFSEKSGIFDLFKNKTIKNLVDYVFGVEVGLDSNGRKNRTGTAMEGLVELFVKNICKKYNYRYMAQATPSRIKLDWGYNVTVDKSERRFDFAVNTGEKLYLLETNFYGGGGSKLKATAGEYKTLYDVVSHDRHDFIWITDGIGWHTANRPLRETFDHNKYILNLKMIELDVLEKILIGDIEL